jgi:hypothetical protein
VVLEDTENALEKKAVSVGAEVVFDGADSSLDLDYMSVIGNKVHLQREGWLGGSSNFVVSVNVVDAETAAGIQADE